MSKTKNAAKTNPHEGHRERLREQFRAHGLDSFADHHVLELLLTYVIPQRDVKPLANLLIEHFGSFASVFEAPPTELAEVKGIGERAALLISLIMQTTRRYQISKAEKYQMLDSTERAGAFIMPRFHGLTHEEIYMVSLDGKLKATHCVKLAEGSVNSANFSVRYAVETALRQRAVHVILAHNHPSGIALPNMTDIATTERLTKALDIVGIHLIDHLIVADGDFVSMRDSGHLNKIKREKPL